MLRALEKHLGRFAIPNLTAVLAVGWAGTFLLGITQPQLAGQIVLVPRLVLGGEVWRLVTFIFIAPLMQQGHAWGNAFTVVFFFFEVYLFWIFGSALDEYWGAFRYNLFLLVGYLFTVACAFVVPDMPTGNTFLYGTVFLAFAFLYPDYTLLLFFVLPVKIKWLALATWLIYGYQLATGTLLTKMLIVAATANFVLFFWRDLIELARTGRRRMRRRATEAADKAARDEAFHKCVICGKTDLSHPKMEFRYCPQCTDSPCYCQDHIHNHEHR